MFVEDVLKKCEVEGHKITRSALYQIGKKEGFITKKEGVRSLDFNKELFLKWIEKTKEKAPKGWITLKEVSEKFNVSLPQAYLLVKDKDCNIKKIGVREVMYVDPKTIEKIIEKRKNRNKIKWEE